jgi:hypothetical protein
MRASPLCVEDLDAGVTAPVRDLAAGVVAPVGDLDAGAALTSN